MHLYVLACRKPESAVAVGIALYSGLSTLPQSNLIALSVLPGINPMENLMVQLGSKNRAPPSRSTNWKQEKALVCN